jgi:hypothetical protein
MFTGNFDGVFPVKQKLKLFTGQLSKKSVKMARKVLHTLKCFGSATSKLRSKPMLQMYVQE